MHGVQYRTSILSYNLQVSTVILWLETNKGIFARFIRCYQTEDLVEDLILKKPRRRRRYWESIGLFDCTDRNPWSRHRDICSLITVTIGLEMIILEQGTDQEKSVQKRRDAEKQARRIETERPVCLWCLNLARLSPMLNGKSPTCSRRFRRWWNVALKWKFSTGLFLNAYLVTRSRPATT